jgi:hypothetical protein
MKISTSKVKLTKPGPVTCICLIAMEVTLALTTFPSFHAISTTYPPRALRPLKEPAEAQELKEKQHFRKKQIKTK